MLEEAFCSVEEEALAFADESDEKGAEKYPLDHPEHVDCGNDHPCCSNDSIPDIHPGSADHGQDLTDKSVESGQTYGCHGEKNEKYRK